MQNDEVLMQKQASKSQYEGRSCGKHQSEALAEQRPCGEQPQQHHLPMHCLHDQGMGEPKEEIHFISLIGRKGVMRNRKQRQQQRQRGQRDAEQALFAAEKGRGSHRAEQH